MVQGKNYSTSLSKCHCAETGAECWILAPEDPQRVSYVNIRPSKYTQWDISRCTLAF